MQYISDLLQRVPCLSALQEALHSAVDLLQDCTQHGNKILVCGNGGSAADAEHIVGELMKGFLLQRPLTPACRRQLICNSPCPVDNAFLINYNNLFLLYLLSVVSRYQQHLPMMWTPNTLLHNKCLV